VLIRGKEQPPTLFHVRRGDDTSERERAAGVVNFDLELPAMLDENLEAVPCVAGLHVRAETRRRPEICPVARFCLFLLPLLLSQLLSLQLLLTQLLLLQLLLPQLLSLPLLLPQLLSLHLSLQLSLLPL